MREKSKAVPSKTLSTRVNIAVAKRFEVRALGASMSRSEYLRTLVEGEPAELRPVLATLGLLIELFTRCREDVTVTPEVTDALRDLILQLTVAARSEMSE